MYYVLYLMDQIFVTRKKDKRFHTCGARAIKITIIKAEEKIKRRI